MINTGVLGEGTVPLVFIQSDTQQRSSIVEPDWCCHSAQSDAAGGGQASLSHTKMSALMLRVGAVSNAAVGMSTRSSLLGS